MGGEKQVLTAEDILYLIPTHPFHMRRVKLQCHVKTESTTGEGMCVVLTWSAVPAGTPASACSLVLCLSPASAASQNPSDDLPPGSGSSGHSEPGDVCWTPGPAASAGLSPGGGERREIQRCYTINTISTCQAFSRRSNPE